MKTHTRTRYSQFKKHLKKLGGKILSRSPYSSDLTPSAFHLFEPFKQALRGKYFRSNEEVKNQAQKWLRDQPEEFYARGIHKLEERRDECTVNVADDYVEK